MNIKKLGLAATLLGAISFLPACWPRNLSPACQERIDHCLAQCPPVDDDMGIGGRGLLAIGDQRSECEKTCHNLCTDPVTKVKPLPPPPDAVPPGATVGTNDP